jgi:hypothetical protein
LLAKRAFQAVFNDLEVVTHRQLLIRRTSGNLSLNGVRHADM